MQLNVTSRHFELTSAIRNYLEERFSALDHLAAEDLHGQVVLDHDSHHGGGEYLLKAQLRGRGDGRHVEVRSANLYDGIDGIVETLKIQLRRLHNRVRHEASAAAVAGQGC